MAVLAGLNVYPVKSCKPMAVSRAMLMPSGLLFDRQWVIVKEDTGKFLSQRQVAELALIEAVLPIELLAASPDAVKAAVASAVLTLTVPEGAPLEVPLVHASVPKTRTITVWNWCGLAADEGDAAAEYLSKYLGQAVRLVRYIGSAAHQAAHGSPYPADLPTQEVARLTSEFAIGFESSFTDAFPLLLTSEASMADLNTRVKGGDEGELLLNRFRGSLVISGATPWAEDSWREVDLVVASAPESPVRLVMVKPCERCKVPTIDQATATVSPTEQPLEALRAFRTGTALGLDQVKKSFKHSVFFGINLVARSTGVVAVGDQLQVVSLRDGGYPPVAA